MLLLFEVDDAVRNVEVFAEAPLVASAQNGGDSGCQVIVDVGGSDVGKWFEKFGDCHVFKAPVKYWRGQNSRSCWSSSSAW